MDLKRVTKAQLAAEIERLKKKAAADGEGFALQERKILKLEEALRMAELKTERLSGETGRATVLKTEIKAACQTYLAIKEAPEGGYAYLCEPPEPPEVVEQGIRLARFILERVK